MEEISYKKLIKELNFPCIILLEQGGKCETKEVVNKNNMEKIKEYKKATEKRDLVFTLLPLPPINKSFGIEDGSYILYSGPREEKLEAPKKSIDEMVEETEPPYLIFKRLKERVKFLGELKSKDKTKFKRYKIKSKEQKETFYIFPKKILSSLFYFYRIKEGQITGHAFASGTLLIEYPCPLLLSPKEIKKYREESKGKRIKND